MLRDPDALISTDDLATRLTRPGPRVYDCTTYPEPLCLAPRRAGLGA